MGRFRLFVAGNIDLLKQSSDTFFEEQDQIITLKARSLIYKID
jgi:hypothetical protein